jgi:ABC-2 type transport system ATP-binding protein
LDVFDLATHRKERMVGFSKGMKQKVALARALLHEPAALFLDEPTSGLDPLSARTVRDMIVGMKHASRSIVLCTHDLDEAERLSDQIAILRHGRIVACDEPALLRSRSSSETTVEVLLAEPCPIALVVLSALDGVIAPSVLTRGQTGSAVASVEYRTTCPTEINPRALAALIGAGAKIISVGCTTRSLEDVYAAAITGAESDGDR